MVTSRNTAWTMVAVVIAITAVAGTAQAADNAPKVGIVNVQKILTDAPRIKQYYEEIEALKRQLETKLEVRSQNLMLDEAQLKELVDLKLRAPQTDKDKARITELEKIERDRDAEFKQLQSTQQPTDQQKARLKELQDLSDKSKSTGDALQKDYSSQFATKGQEVEEKIRVDIQEAVNKVAESKGLSLVFVKDAVLVGGVDLTDDVMGKLDRKAQ